MRFLATDLGNFTVKTSEGKEFNSSFNVLDATDAVSKEVLTYNDTSYVMNQICPFDSQYNKATKNYVPNLLWALEQSGAEDQDEYNIILGLPISTIKQSEKLKADLSNKDFTYKVADKEKTIKIKTVGVVAEGISSFYMLPKEFRDKNVILFDLGSRTCNVIEFVNGKPVKSKTIPMGTIDFFGMVADEYNNNKGTNVETHRIFEYMKDGKIVPSKEVEDAFVSELMQKVLLDFSLDLADERVFTGGGSITLGQALLRYNKDFIFLENPRFSNVNGNAKIGKAKGLDK